MKHLNIRAEKGEIDIFGQIGDSFFEEGNTLDSVKAEISGINSDLTINIASLGGDAFEGLAIHDMIAAHPHNTTMNIVGATASAGAVISQAADEVNISENSLFLVHNSHGLAFGGAEDMESMANDLKQIDARMTSVFAKSTGKEEKEVRALMDEDKFIDAEEAIEFGFAANKIKPQKIAAKVDMNKVMASKLSDDQKEQLKNLNTMKEDSKIITTLKAGIAEIKALFPKKEEVPETTPEPETPSVDEAKIQAIEDGIKKIEASNKALAEENKKIKAENKALRDGSAAREEATETEEQSNPETPADDGKATPHPMDILAKRVIKLQTHAQRN